MSDTDTDTNEPQVDIAAPSDDEAIPEPDTDEAPRPEPQGAEAEAEAVAGDVDSDAAESAEAEAEAVAGDVDSDAAESAEAEAEAVAGDVDSDAAESAEAVAGDVDSDAAESAEAPPEAENDVVTDEELLEPLRMESPYDRAGRWFVVHTQSGYEKKVKQNLEARIVSMNAEDAIYEVVIPMEDYVDFRNGKRIVAQRKMFPGYLLVRAELDDQAWFVIRNTPGVTGFVGQGAKPSPLPRRDVESFLMPKGGTEEQVAQRAKPRLEYEIGETVRVREGPFADFSGEVIELNEDQLKLKVLVNIFGRETPVELEFSKVAKL
jgi:transcription termination/antitermination protein NusG